MLRAAAIPAPTRTVLPEDDGLRRLAEARAEHGGFPVRFAVPEPLSLAIRRSDSARHRETLAAFLAAEFCPVRPAAAAPRRAGVAGDAYWHWLRNEPALVQAAGLAIPQAAELRRIPQCLPVPAPTASLLPAAAISGSLEGVFQQQWVGEPQLRSLSALECRLAPHFRAGEGLPPAILPDPAHAGIGATLFSRIDTILTPGPLRLRPRALLGLGTAALAGLPRAAALGSEPLEDSAPLRFRPVRVAWHTAVCPAAFERRSLSTGSFRETTPCDAGDMHTAAWIHPEPQRGSLHAAALRLGADRLWLAGWRSTALVPDAAEARIVAQPHHTAAAMLPQPERNFWPKILDSPRALPVLPMEPERSARQTPQLRPAEPKSGSDWKCPAGAVALRGGSAGYQARGLPEEEPRKLPAPEAARPGGTAVAQGPVPAPRLFSLVFRQPDCAIQTRPDLDTFEALPMRLEAKRPGAGSLREETVSRQFAWTNRFFWCSTLCPTSARPALAHPTEPHRMPEPALCLVEAPALDEIPKHQFARKPMPLHEASSFGIRPVALGNSGARPMESLPDPPVGNGDAVAFAFGRRITQAPGLLAPRTAVASTLLAQGVTAGTGSVVQPEGFLSAKGFTGLPPAPWSGAITGTALRGAGISLRMVSAIPESPELLAVRSNPAVNTGYLTVPPERRLARYRISAPHPWVPAESGPSTGAAAGASQVRTPGAHAGEFGAPKTLAIGGTALSPAKGSTKGIVPTPDSPGALRIKCAPAVASRLALIVESRLAPYAGLLSHTGRRSDPPGNVLTGWSSAAAFALGPALSGTWGPALHRGRLVSAAADTLVRGGTIGNAPPAEFPFRPASLHSPFPALAPRKEMAFRADPPMASGPAASGLRGAWTWVDPKLASAQVRALPRPDLARRNAARRPVATPVPLPREWISFGVPWLAYSSGRQAGIAAPLAGFREYPHEQWAPNALLLEVFAHLHDPADLPCMNLALPGKGISCTRPALSPHSDFVALDFRWQRKKTIWSRGAHWKEPGILPVYVEAKVPLFRDWSG